ncbi:unnamed protein product [Lampetra fluviatilis]
MTAMADTEDGRCCQAEEEDEEEDGDGMELDPGGDGDDDDDDTSPEPIADPEDDSRNAEFNKEKGNEYYIKKHYNEAYNYYTKAIELCPSNASYYGNRSATLMMLSRYREALEDSQKAVRLDDTFVKGHLREGKCHVALGSSNASVRCFQKVLELEPTNKQAEQELKNASVLLEFENMAEKAFEKKDYRKVVYCMERALAYAIACPKLKIKKAECLALLGRYAEAQSVASDVLRADPTNADALYVRGLCLYYEDMIDRAVQHFVQALKMEPDHEMARLTCKNARLLKQRKEDGNRAFKEGRLEEACQLYSQALTIDPNNRLTNAKLYCNRATVGIKLRRMEQAIEDCTNAILLDESYVKAYHRRAQCYRDTEQYEEAVKDFEKIFSMEKTRENKQLLHEAKLALKKSKRKDYYKVLGVDRSASDDEIKKAYRKRALMHHPDRHSSVSPDMQKEEEKKFKEVGEAFSVLSDPKKRARFDSGQDLEEDGSGFNDLDANNIFRTFFGPGGGFTFESQAPGNFFFQFGQHRDTGKTQGGSAGGPRVALANPTPARDVPAAAVRVADDKFMGCTELKQHPAVAIELTWPVPANHSGPGCVQVQRPPSRYELCSVCNLQLGSAQQAQVHYTSRYHQRRLKQTAPLSNCPPGTRPPLLFASGPGETARARACSAGCALDTVQEEFVRAGSGGRAGSLLNTESPASSSVGASPGEVNRSQLQPAALLRAASAAWLAEEEAGFIAVAIRLKRFAARTRAARPTPVNAAA